MTQRLHEKACQIGYSTNLYQSEAESNLRSTMISLPKLMQHVQPNQQQISPLPLHLCCSMSQKPYFEYMTIYTLYIKTMYDGNLQFLQASDALHKLPHPGKYSTQKNWLTVTMIKYQEKRKPRPCSSKKIYVDKMDCSRSCCCGCKLENVDARKSGGKVCWKRLKILIILFFVSSVTSSVPLPKTYKT